MERENMQNQFTSSVERNKLSSKLCKELFPLWNMPPTQGELQRIIVLGWQNNLNNKQILVAGNWWLWIREVFIDNTITKEQKDLLRKIAVAACNGQPINLVSTRSPELLHAQVNGQGDESLPRSRKALIKIKELSEKSNEFLPTISTIIFADLAIDNFENISKVCDIEKTIRENIQRLNGIAEEIGLKNFKIVRMSQLIGPRGKLGDLVALDGRPLTQINLDTKAEKLIRIVGGESIQSHANMFGWTESQSLEHTRKIGITMGFVGEAVKQMSTTAILIHNEAFIARGMLNNLFTTPPDPLPVVALQDLLERKAAKA